METTQSISIHEKHSRVQHNYLAIVVMITLNTVLGFLWYDLFFGDAWSQAAFGKPMEVMSQYEMSPIPYAINLFAVACSCFFISWLVQKLHIRTFFSGLRLGIYAVVGMALPFIITHYIFLKMNSIVTAIDFGMSAMVVLLNCAVLAVWRIPPTNYNNHYLS